MAVAHDHDPVGQGHGFHLVVGHVDDRRLDLGMQFLDLRAHLHAQLGIKVGKRFVEQEHIRIAHDGTAHGNTLALAAGKLGRPSFQKGLEAESARRFRDRRIDLRLGLSGDLERKSHILCNRHMRVERIGLEDHGDVALARRQVVDHPVADVDFTARDVLQPGDHAERGRLATAGRADQRDELPVLDLKVDGMNDLQLPVFLDQVFQRDGSHVYPFTAPEVRPETRCFCTMNVRVSAGMIMTTASAHMPRQSMVNSAV